MKVNKGLEKFSDIIKSKSSKKPPTYQWQDLALRVIEELKIPTHKRNSVFKTCKENPKKLILKSLNDTKELCQSGEKWKYFFKIISNK